MPDNSITHSRRVTCQKNRFSILRFQDNAILLGHDTLCLGVTVHMTLEDLRAIRDAITLVLEGEPNVE